MKQNLLITLVIGMSLFLTGAIVLWNYRRRHYALRSLSTAMVIWAVLTVMYFYPSAYSTDNSGVSAGVYSKPMQIIPVVKPTPPEKVISLSEQTRRAQAAVLALKTLEKAPEQGNLKAGIPVTQMVPARLPQRIPGKPKQVAKSRNLNPRPVTGQSVTDTVYR